MTYDEAKADVFATLVPAEGSVYIYAHPAGENYVIVDGVYRGMVYGFLVTGLVATTRVGR
jgi:hypothetical protein